MISGCSGRRHIHKGGRGLGECRTTKAAATRRQQTPVTSRENNSWYSFFKWESGGSLAPSCEASVLREGESLVLTYQMIKIHSQHNALILTPWAPSKGISPSLLDFSLRCVGTLKKFGDSVSCARTELVVPGHWQNLELTTFTRFALLSTCGAGDLNISGTAEQEKLE
jgi:hypothetical protein